MVITVSTGVGAGWLVFVVSGGAVECGEAILVCLQPTLARARMEQQSRVFFINKVGFGTGVMSAKIILIFG
jgi:hypothetical protein